MRDRSFAKCRPLIQKFMPTFDESKLSVPGLGMMSPEMIRFSSCASLCADHEKAFGVFLKEVNMNKLLKKHGMQMREKNLIVQPWPFKVTEQTTKEEFARRFATWHVGIERYVELERA